MSSLVYEAWPLPPPPPVLQSPEFKFFHVPGGIPIAFGRTAAKFGLPMLGSLGPQLGLSIVISLSISGAYYVYNDITTLEQRRQKLEQDFENWFSSLKSVETIKCFDKHDLIDARKSFRIGDLPPGSIVELHGEYGQIISRTFHHTYDYFRDYSPNAEIGHYASLTYELAKLIMITKKLPGGSLSNLLKKEELTQSVKNIYKTSRTIMKFHNNKKWSKYQQFNLVMGDLIYEFVRNGAIVVSNDGNVVKIRWGERKISDAL